MNGLEKVNWVIVFTLSKNTKAKGLMTKLKGNEI